MIDSEEEKTTAIEAIEKYARALWSIGWDQGVASVLRMLPPSQRATLLAESEDLRIAWEKEGK